jgi:hypothetical protein
VAISPWRDATKRRVSGRGGWNPDGLGRHFSSTSFLISSSASASGNAAIRAASLEVIAGMVEDAEVERAIYGMPRLVLYQGKVVKVNGEPLYQIEFSDPLLITLLKKFNPAYKERTELQHSGSIDLVQRMSSANPG